MKREEARPDALQVLRQVSDESRRRALFRAHLGYARGVGATTAMLDEARRRTSRGTDVVVASYRVHGDPAAALAGVEVLGRRQTEAAFDADAVLARNPEVVCIDDLAVADVHGRPAIESIPRLLATGMTVLGTLHLLSIRSAAETFAAVLGGRPPGFLVDDDALPAFHELELVDIPPADLLQRLRALPVLRPGELAVALQQELRPTALQSLRTMAFRVIAEHTDRQLVGYMRESAPESPWAVRGRIVMCLPPRHGLDERIRRGAGYAAAQDAMFTVVSVRSRSMTDDQKEWMGGYATLTHQLGGEFVHLHGRRPAPVLVDYIRKSLATEVILGHRHRGGWRPADTTSEIIRRLAGVDVHILRTEKA